MKIDISAHIVPPGLREAVSRIASGRIALQQSPVLDSLDARFRVMDRYPDVLQVLSQPHSLEDAGETGAVYELARVNNNGMAEIADKYPDRFAGFVANIPLSDIDSALKETDRTVMGLGSKGIMITAMVKRPLDLPQFTYLYEKMAQYDLPIFLHPMGGPTQPDYDGESVSKYLIWGLWGWPYQTTLAMTRLVFSGVFDRFPNIKFITHHAGAMLPFNAYRIHNWYDPAAERKEDFIVRLKKHPADYFRMFYNDIANAGNTAGLMCAHDFFGAYRLLFASDMPYGSPSGYGDTLYENTIQSIEDMAITPEEKEAIFTGNARSVLRLK
ncbi:MAG: amidohydrolase 2 [Dehalococcoidia bacterium]|nr:amidohydrolase 2 [Dehalococcoidia bacterium]